MTAIQYGIYFLISRPRYDEKLKIWFAYASVSWSNDKFHYHQLKNLERTFENEEEAFGFGYVAARTWVDEYESD
jgi:hypothetical protein